MVGICFFQLFVGSPQIAGLIIVVLFVGYLQIALFTGNGRVYPIFLRS